MTTTAHRKARELALLRLTAEGRHMASYLTEVDQIARYIETGELPGEPAAPESPIHAQRPRD